MNRRALKITLAIFSAFSVGVGLSFWGTFSWVIFVVEHFGHGAASLAMSMAPFGLFGFIGLYFMVKYHVGKS